MFKIHTCSILTAVILALVLLAGCVTDAGTVNNSGSTAQNAPAPAASEKTEASQAGKPPLRVALVTASGGLGDRSFNDAGWIGFQRAEKELGVEIKVIEPQSVSDYQSTLTATADGGYDFIMAIGNDWVETIANVAPKYPDTKFGGVNINVDLDNVSVAVFSDFEAGFLAGALAGKMTSTNTIGYLGGMDVPAIQRFYVGYEEGAKYVKPDINVLVSYVGAFNDPGLGKEYSVQLISQKADVIYHGAGKSGEGLFDAIKGAPDGCYAIGCDSDQDYIVEGRVLASTLKRVDVAAYTMIKEVLENDFKSGKVVYNIANGGIGLSDMTYTKDTVVSKEVQDEIEAIKQKISDGEITITDVFAQ